MFGPGEPPPPKKRKKATKKNPLAPKRFKSAYICFSQAKREEIKASMPEGTKVTYE